MVSHSLAPVLRVLPVNKHGRSLPFISSGALCFGHPARNRDAGGVLAGVFELARKILAGIHRCIAFGLAADSSWILRAGGHGAARAAGKIVDRAAPWPPEI